MSEITSAETNASNVTTQVPGATPFERVQNLDKAMDTHTPRFLAAMKEAARNM